MVLEHYKHIPQAVYRNVSKTIYISKSRNQASKTEKKRLNPKKEKAEGKNSAEIKC